jgi:hypothetical protein
MGVQQMSLGGGSPGTRRAATGLADRRKPAQSLARAARKAAQCIQFSTVVMQLVHEEDELPFPCKLQLGCAWGVGRSSPTRQLT